MKIKFFLPFLFLFPSITLFAQARNTTMQLFTHNWFVGAGGGGYVYFGDHNRQTSIGSRLAPNFDIYAGKWLNNYFGVRLGANGFINKGLTQNGSHTTGEVFDATRFLEKQKFNFVHFRADVMFHWTNDIYADNMQHIYNMIPYAGIGVMNSLDDKKVTRLTPHLGFLQILRISNKIALTLDVRGNIVGDGFDGEKGGREFEGAAAANLGVIYSF